MMTLQKHRPHISSFYHIPAPTIAGKLCQGMACFVARRLNPNRWQEASAQDPRIHCLGKCYMGPSSTAEDFRPTVKVHAPESVVLANVAYGSTRTVDAYIKRGGYEALKKALGLLPKEVIEIVEASALRGCGGAGFPTGRKWRAVFEQGLQEKFVIANADEGDPGAYIDRFIMEDDPHRLIEALAIAGYAIGAKKGYVYLRKEYAEAYHILQRALEEARDMGFLGGEVLKTNFSFDIELVLGQGSYICGEETALLNSIGGKRPEIRPRPPYPTQCGLFGRPTLITS